MAIDFPFGAVAGGAFDLAGGAISSALAVKEAKKQRDFQERMYKHRYQYQMKDMRKAGLNPILMSAGGAPGAPSGAAGRIPDMGSRSFSARGMEIDRHRKHQALLTNSIEKEYHSAQLAAQQSSVANNQAILSKHRAKLAPEMARAELGHTQAQAAATAATAQQQAVMADLYQSIGKEGLGLKTFAPLIMGILGRTLLGRGINNARSGRQVMKAYEAGRRAHRLGR